MTEINEHGPKSEMQETIDARHQLMHMLLGFVKPMVLNALCLLNIPDILAKAGPGTFLSAEEVAKQLPSETVNLAFLGSILNGGVQFGILAGKKETGSEGKAAKRLYGLNSLSKLLVRESPGSMAPGVLMQMHKVAQAPWMHLHDAVLTDEFPFTVAHGKSLWAQTKDDPTWNKVVNDAMASFTSLVVDTVVNKYEGFQGVKTLVDVGGGTGRFLREIVAKHPEIHGVNFDLPHVIAQAPHAEGVEQVGGNMFESIPEGDAICMKQIMHDWDDEKCVQILKNCIKSLPAHGKVVIVDIVVPGDDDDNNPFKTRAVCMDLTMLAHTDGGMERTKEQWEELVHKAGFARCHFVMFSSEDGFEQSLVEAYKN